MRVEYSIYQRMVWDASYRRLLAASSPDELHRLEPSCIHCDALIRLAQSSGIAEEVYRRIASIYKVSSEIFPNARFLFIAHFGEPFFENILSTYFVDNEDWKGTIEILEPFDGYVAGPRLLRAAAKHADLSQATWITELAQYDWAIWHAGRVASGWPAIDDNSPLVPGASLFSAQYDLPGLVREVKRLRGSAVSAEIFRHRIIPAPGSYYAVVLPKKDQVVKAIVNQHTFSELQKCVTSGSDLLQSEMSDFVKGLGIFG